MGKAGCHGIDPLDGSRCGARLPCLVHARPRDRRYLCAIHRRLVEGATGCDQSGQHVMIPWWPLTAEQQAEARALDGFLDKARRRHGLGGRD